jgi:hypothetical protein
MVTTKRYLLFICLLTLAACKKKEGTAPGNEIISGGIIQKTETSGGITYRLFTKQDQASFKGILVMGSGNNEANPSAGSLDGAPETALCQKAAANGYAAAIVQYSKPPGNTTWNDWAKLLGEDYDKFIVAIANKYGIDKNKSVVGGYSYASYMLLTNNAYYNSIPYCKGVLAACGAINADNPNFHIPIYSINCSGNNEGNYNGRGLYDRMPQNAVKARSEGITDNSCTQHCGKNWTDEMYAKMAQWLQ